MFFLSCGTAAHFLFTLFTVCSWDSCACLSASSLLDKTPSRCWIWKESLGVWLIWLLFPHSGKTLVLPYFKIKKSWPIFLLCTWQNVAKRKTIFLYTRDDADFFGNLVHSCSRVNPSWSWSCARNTRVCCAVIVEKYWVLYWSNAGTQNALKGSTGVSSGPNIPRACQSLRCYMKILTKKL